MTQRNPWNTGDLLFRTAGACFRPGIHDFIAILGRTGKIIGNHEIVELQLETTRSGSHGELSDGINVAQPMLRDQSTTVKKDSENIIGDFWIGVLGRLDDLQKLVIFER